MSGPGPGGLRDKPVVSNWAPDSHVWVTKRSAGVT